MFVLPALDLYRGRVARLVKGAPKTARFYDLSPLAYLELLARAGAREVHIVDLDAALGGVSGVDTVVRAAKDLGLAVEVGGGIRSPESAEAALASGADSVVLGSAAADPKRLCAIVRAAGAAHVTVALDVQDGRVRIDGWRQAAVASAAAIAALAESFGVRRFECTAIERDGTGLGPDAAVAESLCAPGRTVLASGGVRSEADIRRLRATKLSGVIVGKALLEGWVDPGRALAS